MKSGNRVLGGVQDYIAVLFGTVALFVSIGTASGGDSPALSINPANPHYFLFRGKPAVLIAASEHYGSVLNRPFDFRKYLADQADKQMTMTRTFLLYRELAAPTNPMSPCKPAPQDYIAPWPRTGPGKALDGQPTFDLDSWNDEYFKRLHDFLDAASERGIIVELTVFSNSYWEGCWALNPLRAENNNQGVGKIEWEEYTSLKNKAVVDRQIAYARKIIQETAGYDNIYYEVCNEPGGGVPGHVSPAEVDAWQTQIAGVLRDEMAKLHRPHLLAGFDAFNYTPRVTTTYDDTFGGSLFQIVNVHPLPDTILGGHNYQMGNFMSKELRQADLIDFGNAVSDKPKPCVWDEDNAASMFTNPIGWTIHRKRAWTALLSGCHYDMIDFSVQIGRETGTPEANAALRTWFKHLSTFFRSIDFVNGAPQPQIITAVPGRARAVAFGVAEKDYAVYFADPREVTDPKAGQPIGGEVQFILPAGNYHVTRTDPTTGAETELAQVPGGAIKFDLAPFKDDVAIRFRKVAADAPAAAAITHHIMVCEYSDAAHRLVEISPEGKLLWEHKFPSIAVCFRMGTDGNVLFADGGNPTGVQEVNHDHKVIFDYRAKCEQVLTCDRLPNGNILLAEEGPCQAVEINKDGAVVSIVKMSTTEKAAHRQVRCVHQLENGHILACHEAEAVVREYDRDGKTVWEYPNVTNVFEAMRLPNGNTLIGCGIQNRIIEVTPDKKVVWELTSADAPELNLAWITSLQVLKNGNLVVANFLRGHEGKGAHAFEVTRDQAKRIVWKFADHDMVKAITMVRVLDDH